MRKGSILLSMLVLVAMAMTACGGGPTSTNVASSPPPVTADSTSTEELLGTATESPTDGAATGTAGVPVTGDVNPARLSNQLDFTVWSQDGEQLGEVNDMVLDLDNTRVSYVIVGTGGFLDLGERDVLVPWDALQLQTGTGDTTGGQQNAFILQTDLDTFRNAPDFDLSANFPQMGQPVGDWDADIRNFWQSGGATAKDTPSPDGTAVPDRTATISPDGTTMPEGSPTAGADQGTATPGGATLQGVMLASEVLGSTISLGVQGQAQGQDQGQATATAGTDQDTAQGDLSATINDLIVDTDMGDIQYIVLSTHIDNAERWIPVPLALFQWDPANGSFILNANTTMLQNAPFFENGQFPDITAEGWNSEFDTFWQNNGAEATSTP
jgi:sporulation protein YlmC with PRC-barrel domain